LCCFQSGSSEKIKAIYANEKKDDPQLFILTQSLSTCDILSQSPTPTPLSCSSEETPGLKECDLTTQINNDLPNQEYSLSLDTYDKLGQLECEAVRLSNGKIAESLIEIKDIIDVKEIPEKFETLIEDISKLPPRTDSRKVDLSTAPNDLIGLISRGADGESHSVLLPGLIKMEAQLKNLLQVKGRESERDLMMLEDRSVRELKILV
jgi:hypothetical protein